jgi:hypothetical protein
MIMSPSSRRLRRYFSMSLLGDHLDLLEVRRQRPRSPRRIDVSLPSPSPRLLDQDMYTSPAPGPTPVRDHDEAQGLQVGKASCSAPRCRR